MNQIIEQLKSFNSKERFFLVGNILGNVTFAPSPDFRKKIGDDLHVQLPENVFAAMDYHLDWLYASLYLASNQEQTCVFQNNEQLIKAQQEDIDFLFAFEIDDVCHIILLEAKGVGSCTNKQMNSKSKRFGEIFGQDGKRWPGVIPHFALVSPIKPANKLQTSTWPAWMSPDNTVPYIELPIQSGLKKVTRCDKNGKANINGEYWTVIDR
jgi:hypothetical protein